jgi:hypothetical protein
LLDTARRVFDELYIQLLEDSPNANPTLDFVRNLTGAQQSSLTADTQNSDAYWSVPLRAVFEADAVPDHNARIPGDGDPDGEPTALGAMTGPRDPANELVTNAPNAAIFMESIRDGHRAPPRSSTVVSEDEAIGSTIAHELGHTLSLVHDGDSTGFLMCGKESLSLATPEPIRTRLTAAQKAQVRSAARPRFDASKAVDMCPVPMFSVTKKD